MLVRFDQMSSTQFANWVRMTQHLDPLPAKGSVEQLHKNSSEHTLVRHAFDAVRLYDGGRHVRARIFR